MSVLDDFNRFAFDRAKAKYARAQFEQMTHDDWVALVEGYREDAENAPDPDELESLEGKLADAEDELATARGELSDAQDELATARGELSDAQDELAEARERIADLEADLAERD